MKRLATTVSLLALAVSLAACSGDKKSEPKAGTPAPTATQGAAVLTEAQATAALPQLADLPAGYAAEEYSHEDLPTGCVALDAASQAADALKPTWVGSSFGKGEFGLTVDGEIGVFASAADAVAVLDAFAKGFAGCPSWKFSDDGLEGTLTSKVEGNPKLGDKALLVTMGGSAAEQTFASRIYIVVVSNTLAFAAESGLGSDTDDPQVELPGIIASMVTKLQAA